MKLLRKYGKILLALVLLVAAALLYANHRKALLAHEREVDRLTAAQVALQETIRSNQRYEGVQPQLEAARAQLAASRLALYEKFPAQLREEDQIAYMIYLESVFGRKVSMGFGQVQPIAALQDGSRLMGLTLTVDYETSYQGFQDMITYLATDARITSVQLASIAYDPARDVAKGTVTLLLYILDTQQREDAGHALPTSHMGEGSKGS